MKIAKNNIHRAWKIMIGCCLMQMGTLGILFNCTGVFFPPVCQDMGFTVGKMSMGMTIRGIVSIVSLPIAGYLLPRYNIRVLLSAATICGGVTMALMSQFTQLYQWYIGYGLMGLFGSFLFLLPTPIILGNWFIKKRGLATGIALGSSGLSGAVMNILASGIISTIGWRYAYVILAACCLILALPATLFIIRFKPEDVELHPYGFDSIKTDASLNIRDGYLYKEALCAPIFYLVVFMACCTGFTMIYSKQFPSYAISIGWSITVGSMMTSLSMVGNVFSKLLMGALSDKIGVRNCAIGGATAVGSSLILLLIFPGIIPVAVVSSLMSGVAMSMVSVIMPLIIRNVFGGHDYSAIFSSISMIVSFIGSVGVGIVGLMFDISGSYTGAFILGASLNVIVIFCVVITYKTIKPPHLTAAEKTN